MQVGTLAYFGSALCSHGQNPASAVHLCGCGCVCVRASLSLCVRAHMCTRVGVGGYVLLAHVCDDNLSLSWVRPVAGSGGRVTEENGGESRVANLHQTTWATWRVPPESQRPGVRALRGPLGLVRTRASPRLSCRLDTWPSPGIMYTHRWASWMWKGGQR